MPRAAAPTGSPHPFYAEFGWVAAQGGPAAPTADTLWQAEGGPLAPGKDVTLTVHPGTGHAFMGPHNALGTHDPELAAKIWPQAMAFLHDKLG